MKPTASFGCLASFVEFSRLYILSSIIASCGHEYMYIGRLVTSILNLCKLSVLLGISFFLPRLFYIDTIIFTCLGIVSLTIFPSNFITPPSLCEEETGVSAQSGQVEAPTAGPNMSG